MPSGSPDDDEVPESVSLYCNAPGKNDEYHFPTNYIRTTKYTILSFVPYNLFEQFHKLSNWFFLANMVIALVPGVSPVFPATTILPLVAVLGAAALRDAYEDFQRYKSDRRANALEVQIVNSSGEVIKVPSKDVAVGDVLYLEKKAEIPVDCVVISTSLEDGACFVETANLDGETNMKPKQSRNVIHQRFRDPKSIVEFSGAIVCDQPNESLHKWQGKFSVPSFPDQAVDMDNFLLRGCSVQNVDWVMAVTVYTGVHTKLFKNLKQKPPKASRLDKKLNRLILMILVVQQLLIFVVCGLHVGFRNSPAGRAFHIEYWTDAKSDGSSFGFMYMTYFILLSLMMPISLFVSLEMCKMAQAWLMMADDRMTNNNDRMRARTSSLNEELSQVQYIFSDKTGTLTENQMRFAECFAGDTAFNELKALGGMQKLVAKDPASRAAAGISKFLRLLSLCNTVVINVHPDTHEITYDGSSTDEIALVGCAVTNGWQLVSRTSDTMTIRIAGKKEDEVVDVDAVLPFTPERKMMSVVLREKDGTMRMYTKGADSSVLARLDLNPRLNDTQEIAHAKEFLDRCARDGLRTLVCAERVFTAEGYATWKKQWDTAYLTVSANRGDLVHEAALAGESGLKFIGCTAIEDRLQDEVPETIHFLLRCGIVIWVLTGDKRETAVNIAGTSRLLDPQKDFIVHLDISFPVPIGRQILDAQQQVKTAKAANRKATFIVDGKSLEDILKNLEMFENFRNLGLMVNSAVCCRVTPLQKSAVVEMFQALGNTCLGVGDGANDVSMIQAARVGVGILGLEGSQAERSADYAIPRFRHLRRLIAVHGRYSLVRNSNLIQYSFYKNVVYSMTQVFFSFYNGYSGQTIYDSWMIVLFNMAFTLFPPLVMGIIDFDVRDSFLLRYPGLYSELRSPFAVRMSRASSFMWLMMSVFHSWVIYYGTYLSAMVDDRVSEGKDAGLWSAGTVMMNLLLVVVSLQAAMSFLSWTFLHILSIVLSFIAYTVFLFAYSAIPPKLGFESGFYTVPAVTERFSANWLTMMLFSVAIFGPQLIVMYFRRSNFAIDMHHARVGHSRQRKELPWESVSGGAGGGGHTASGAVVSSPGRDYIEETDQTRVPSNGQGLSADLLAGRDL